MVLLLFGLALLLVSGPMQQLFNRLFFGSAAGKPEYASAAGYLEFAFAVLGAVMIGWSVCMLLVLLLRGGTRDAWLAIALSLVAWYVPDTAFSLHAGFWQNAVLNTGLGLVFVIPLIATAGVLHDTQQARRAARHEG